MSVAVGLDPALEPGKLGVGGDFRPPEQILADLAGVGRELDVDRRHILNLRDNQTGVNFREELPSMAALQLTRTSWDSLFTLALPVGTVSLMRHFAVLSGIGLIAVVLGVARLTGGTTPVQTDAEMRQNAEAFQANCAACHGQDGRGDTAVGRQMSIPDLASEAVQEQTDEEMREKAAEVTVHSSLRQRIGDTFLRALTHVRTFGEGR
jgi:cytochrome c553